MTEQNKGRIALVTGANRGIGLETVKQLAQQGMHVLNTIALTQTLLPLIKKSPAGRIVFLSSGLGSLTLHSDPKSPIYNYKVPAYDISKTALNGYGVHLAYELKDTPIKVNVAHPGSVVTDMNANGNLQVDEGAKTSVALATLPNNGYNGKFIHLGKELPW
jgi:NAD(P)-dependent dehydrogenase (short-subunit alcohol dehydrogenase family)